MPVLNKEMEFVNYVVDLMQAIGPITTKGLFGCYGLFLDGLMFGLVADSTLYLKSDKETEREFKVKGLEMFAYNKKGKEIKMSYYQAPEEALEDIEEMNFWVNKAYGAALRAGWLSEQKRNGGTINVW